MSKWADHDMTAKVMEALAAVPVVNEGGHHFGRSFVTSYQIAIAVERRHPGTAAALGKSIGGSGVGEHVSMAQYIGNELSKQLRDGREPSGLEGRFLSNQDVTAHSFVGPEGPITSSVIDTGYDLALYRLQA